MSDPRPPIPLPIKRAVRQRCGFGCVVCGSPLVEYDHIEGYEPGVPEVADALTLLCPDHHAQKTRGLLPVARVREANREPHNVRRGQTTPFGLNFAPGAMAQVVLGLNLLEWDGAIAAIVVDNELVVGFGKDEHSLLLYMTIRDESNEPAVVVQANELVMRANAWDVEFTGRDLTVRRGPGAIVLELRFEPPTRIVFARAQMHRNGLLIEVNPRGDLIIQGQARFEANHMVVPIGLKIGPSPDFAGGALLNMNFPRNPPFGPGARPA